MEYLDIIMEVCYNKSVCNIYTINEANHSFNGYESALANKVLSIQKRR